MGSQLPPSSHQACPLLLLGHVGQIGRQPDCPHLHGTCHVRKMMYSVSPWFPIRLLHTLMLMTAFLSWKGASSILSIGVARLKSLEGTAVCTLVYAHAHWSVSYTCTPKLAQSHPETFGVQLFFGYGPNVTASRPKGWAATSHEGGGSRVEGCEAGWPTRSRTSLEVPGPDCCRRARRADVPSAVCVVSHRGRSRRKQSHWRAVHVQWPTYFVHGV